MLLFINNSIYSQRKITKNLIVLRRELKKKLEQQESCRMKNTERNYPIFFLARKIKTARAPGTPISDKGAFFVGEVSG